MSSYSETEDDFFDAHNVFAKMSDSDFECSSEDCSTSGFKYVYWVGNLDSVDERRDRFLRFTGLSSKSTLRDEEDDFSDEIEEGLDEKRENTEPVIPKSSDFRDPVLCQQHSLSCRSDKDSESVALKENLSVKIGNLDESSEDILIDRSFDFGGLTKYSTFLRSSQKEGENTSLLDRWKNWKMGFLQKLYVMARIAARQEISVTLKPDSTKLKGGACSYAVRVHTHKKKSKELSSLYATQEFPAHNGSISTIKFSLDGRYLATAGDDAIVRIWEVFEDADPRKYEIQGKNPSSFYFSMNHLFELAPLKVDKEKTRLSKSSEMACVILPPKVFRILEKPVHEFHGHRGEILSLSWSRKGYLLSSCIDKTVRMWQVGHHQCLKVFTHNNYVTCVEFNPVDENYFISGCIDGKVRIWEVHCCQVIDWIDIKAIVTAVCYFPDGKGSIVGTLEGNCSFYNIIDNRLHLDAQICLMSKKKWPKRITGFQFCPADSKRVIVSSADSQVRILCGVNLVGKFKGNRSSGSQMSASFTSDGKHIVSAAEDSNVYIWNHIGSNKPSSKPKTTSSYEKFFSQNTSIAIPWCGIKSIASALPSPRSITNNFLQRSTIDSPRTSSSSTNRGFFLESLLKGPPTWPAETLSDSAQVSVSPSMRKSEYKFLKNAYQSTFVASHMWGLVIVAAGWDGRIRTYLNYGLPIRL